ncbi:peptide ABC transporter substrate-binding protein [Gudongella sp. DL1XJH-153]|uniref:peptide ABC transporter substrate-binding protein n=1 Tax=Gudongella sp. DL1XJH-153 TaxID=3409804 RepID=UPI003BB5482B
MNKKLLALLLVLAMSITVLAGCSQPAEEPAEEPAEQPGEQPAEEPAGDESVFLWNVGADPKTIDPVLNGASDGGDVINQTFEGLVREKSGEIYPGIAETWDVSEDGMTVTFNLRESNWSDGTPLTANDFVYSWKRGMDPATASEYAWIWEYTNVVGAFDAVNGGSLDDVGVTAVDDLTLEVKLETPTDYIVSLLSFYHFLPTKQEAVEAGADGAWAKDPENAISNGPFKLTSYEIGGGLTLVKNDEYWNAEEVKIDRIEGKFIDEQSTAFQAYQSGELHFLPDVPPAEIPRLMAEDPNFFVFPLLGTYYYNYNMDLELFQDVRVRKALNLAVDRSLITETMASGQIPAAGFVPVGFLDHEGEDFAEKSGTYGIPTDDSQIEEAKALLAEAGYPDGEGFPEFTIMYNTSEGHQQVAELVQEMLKTNLGIETQLENQEWAVFQDTRKEGDYEMARGGWLTDFMDPMGLLAIFTTENAYNDPNYSNARYDELLSTAAKTRGAEHFEALYEAQEILMTELPVMPIYYYTDVMLVSPDLVGWDRSVLGTIDFSTAELVN